MSENIPHIPVLLPEVLAALNPQAGQTIIDGTFGAGGYTRAILATGANVIALDQDPTAIANGQAMVAEFKGRLTLIHAPFSEMGALVHQPVDGVVFDIGVSSMQLDQSERGFSFRFDAPLDMRMGNAGPTAADLCNTLSEAELAKIIYRYGDEQASRRIAKEIVAARPLHTTRELVKCVEKVIKAHGGMKIHPATKTFQALRIAVNDELGELIRGLCAAHALLKPGGVLAVVSFHSLEDTIVKQFFKGETERNPIQSRHMPMVKAPEPDLFTLRQRKPVTPSDEECKANPRARSAKLRAGIKNSNENYECEARINAIGQYLLKSFMLK